jgi:hypothetical protein
MLNLELKEKQRQSLLILKKIPDVPRLAIEIKNYKQMVDEEKEQVRELSEKIENPA